ncbi:MAG TPA: TIGR02270 family protein [Burkholderiaceae bacterium]|nr:TIGR02270 family protein [Burkholderiaceae bacterium]
MSSVAASQPATWIAQQVEDCIALRERRSVLVRSARVTLEDLLRLDGHLRTCLDGLQAVWEPAATLADKALAKPRVGAAFTAAVLALQNKDTRRLDQLIALARTAPEVRRGMISALGWVPAKSLREISAGWFATPDRFLRRLGIAACAVHRVDPGALLAGAIESRDPGLRSVAAGCAGELGRLDMREACLALLDDADPRVRMHAARSAVLLGDRAQALDALAAIALADAPLRVDALPVAILASDRSRTRALLKRMAQARDERQPATIRFVVYAVALAGDLQFMDWLISLMRNPVHARLAGEAFALMTGADLVLLGLERQPLQSAPANANDASNDPAVAFHDDEGMAWPDAALVRAWWEANKAGFSLDERHFVGTIPDAAHCKHVLRESRQRRRWVAALHLALGAPGSVLFNPAAPAWRQTRLLQAK